MPAREKPRITNRLFLLRCIGSVFLAVGFIVCVVMARESGRSLPESTVTKAPRRAGEPAPALPEQVDSRRGILIDPGHGGADPGTVANGQFEKTWTLTVSKALAKELRRRGWQVELTRTEDSAVPLIDRSLLSNRQPRLAFVSIHFNAGGPDASGLETYYAWPKTPETMARMDVVRDVPVGMAVRDDRGRLLAEAIQASACGATGSKNRGARNEPGYLVLNRTECPAVLVECGFLTNAAECREIQSEAWRGKLVRGLADGLEGWLRQAAAPDYGIVTEEISPEVPVTVPVVGTNP